MKKNIAIIGAGPAGLTSALILARHGHDVTVYEADPEYVGGLSKTVRHGDYRIDIGGHRFYTKDASVQKFWQDALGPLLLKRKRISRIFYKGRFLSYPLRPQEVFWKLSPLDSVAFLFSYIHAQIFSKKELADFESWIVSRFGSKLFHAFFKSYTEKVWGMECKDISSDWAKQRINNLNITSLLRNLVLQVLKIDDRKVKSLIDEFEYPVHGPGMLWEKVRDNFLTLGGKVIHAKEVAGITKESSSEKWVVRFKDNDQEMSFDHVINTAPLKNFIASMTPPPPAEILDTLGQFQYRGFITVAVMFKGQNPFPDNWLYIHDPTVKVARIQNYGNWSEKMVPGPGHICLGLEYFCQKDDMFWQMSDKELGELALTELTKLKIAYTKDELDFKIIRSPNAYPIYDLNYRPRLETIKKFVNQFPNLHLIGRSGLHRYNNQDHSIKTAMLTCENILSEKKLFDPWNVNQDAEYIEILVN